MLGYFIRATLEPGIGIGNSIELDSLILALQPREDDWRSLVRDRDGSLVMPDL